MHYERNKKRTETVENKSPPMPAIALFAETITFDSKDQKKNEAVRLLFMADSGNENEARHRWKLKK